jgi:hypothetical protein
MLTVGHERPLLAIIYFLIPLVPSIDLGAAQPHSITAHYAKAIDEEIERRRDASPACQKSNRTSCLKMLDY